MSMGVEQTTKSTYINKIVAGILAGDSRTQIEVVVEIVEENHECERETKVSLT